MPLKPDQVKLALKISKEIAMAEAPHTQRIARWRNLDAVYAYKLDANKDKWRHDLHPPVALTFVEQVVAAIVDDQPQARVEPLRQEDIDHAKTLEKVLDRQRNRDRYQEKWPLFVRQGLIRGFTVAKVLWQQDWADVFVRNDPMGQELPEPVLQRKLVRDQPSFEVVSVYDWWWDPAATSILDARYVFYRTYQTLETLKDLEKDGVYQNIDEIKATGVGEEQTGGRNLSKHVEIIERWTKDSLTVIANRKIVIADGPNPFHHNHIPFVTATPIPAPPDLMDAKGQLRTLDGWGVCELVGDMQLEYWLTKNQRHDNTEILCNAILEFDSSMNDQEVFGDAFPGTRIPVDRPLGQTFEWHTPNTSILQASLEAEQALMREMQDATGAVPYLSGASEGTVDQNTATGISIIQSTAQRRLQHMKQQFAYAAQRAGEQWLDLNQNLMSRPERVVEMGADGYQFSWADPKHLSAARCEYVVEDVAESLNQQQKRQEAILKLQTLVAVANSNPMLTPVINVLRAVQDFSEAFGDDRDAFLNQQSVLQPPMGVPGSGPGIGAPAAQPTPGSLAGGVAAPPQAGAAPVNNAPARFFPPQAA